MLAFGEQYKRVDFFYILDRVHTLSFREVYTGGTILQNTTPKITSNQCFICICCLMPGNKSLPNTRISSDPQFRAFMECKQRDDDHGDRDLTHQDPVDLPVTQKHG